MGIHRENGYSATVEGFVVVHGERLRLAKTNGVSLVLSEPYAQAVAPETDANLVVIIDGTTKSKKITLRDGIVVGQQSVPYVVAIPF